MEWSRPAQQGEVPTPRSGHAGVTIGENWFIVGGGDNKSGRFMHFFLGNCEKMIFAWLFQFRVD